MTSTFRVNKGGGVSASSLPPKASSSSTPASECPVSLPLPPLLRQTSYVALTGDAYSPLGLDRSIRCHGTENNGMSGGRMLWGEAASSHPPPVVPRCALWCQARLSLSLARVMRQNLHAFLLTCCIGLRAPQCAPNSLLLTLWNVECFTQSCVARLL